MRKRTNVELEMDYVERIRRRYGLATIKDAVDLALRRLAGEITATREEVLKLQGSMPDFEIGFKEDEPIEDIWPS
jgi:Arc/MetJ family transcription regulator